MSMVVVTGCCGFIGTNLCNYLLNRGDKVFGIDIMRDNYDKTQNLNHLRKLSDRFEFFEENVCNSNIISIYKPDTVCHLAAIAGVRYSLENPEFYCENNITGFIHILQECVKNNVKQLVYASSSSVYGNRRTPFLESMHIDSCQSPYACTKLSMEIFAKSYFEIYGLKSIGLRFFTVYGPRGRPDMSPYIFLNKINMGEVIDKYGDGESSRDYTYTDDIVKGIIGAIDNKKNIECGIYNLGNNKPITLNKFISICEEIVGKKAKINNKPRQLGDVNHTCADIEKAKSDLDYNPTTSLYDGLKKAFFHMERNGTLI